MKSRYRGVNQGLGLRCVMSSAAATERVRTAPADDVVVGGERRRTVSSGSDHDLILSRSTSSWIYGAGLRRHSAESPTNSSTLAAGHRVIALFQVLDESLAPCRCRLRRAGRSSPS